MPVSFSGLDMSWLSDPAKRLPPRKVKRERRPNKRSTKVASPMVMGDISPFVNVANSECTHEISSRSQLRAFERDFGCYQVGNDFKPGEIAAKNEAKLAAREELAKGIQAGWADAD
jgi:hypothetical protein